MIFFVLKLSEFRILTLHILVQVIIYLLYALFIKIWQ